MDVGKFLCKIGMHKGGPVIADDEFDDVENSYVKVIVYEKKNPYLFDKFIDKLYRHNPTDVNIIKDAYGILEESGNFDFEAEDTLTTLLKYVGEMDLDVKKIKLEELMRGLYLEAHDHIWKVKI